jgi:glycosyltransferase involved in cell wall biosynthesis
MPTTQGGGGMHPRLSLLVPTRGRPAQLARLLDSLADTTSAPDSLEIVLVLDDDDPASAMTHRRLNVVHTVGPPGRTMGRLNQAGYLASAGDFVMLLNDDVVARTPGWDGRVRPWLDEFADGVVLVHVNDTLMRHHLCTFPLVSRTFCELAGGVCPEGYRRYRIDDHVEDVFNLLAALGEPRTVYLPDVVFEHTNGVEVADGVREYHADPAGLALDAPAYDALLPERKRLALRLLKHIQGERLRQAERRLDAIGDPLALRQPGRFRNAADLPPLGPPRRGVLHRLMACFRRRGVRGLAQAAGRRLAWFSAPGVV